MLLSVLLSTSAYKCNDAEKLAYLKGAARRTKTVYIPEIINGVSLLKSQQGLDEKAKALLDKASSIASKVQANIVPLTDFIIALASLDKTDKVDFAAKLEAARAAWAELMPLLGEINAHLASLVTDNPILRAAITSTPLLVDGFLGLVQSRVQ